MTVKPSASGGILRQLQVVSMPPNRWIEMRLGSVYTRLTGMVSIIVHSEDYPAMGVVELRGWSGFRRITYYWPMDPEYRMSGALKVSMDLIRKAKEELGEIEDALIGHYMVE